MSTNQVTLSPAPLQVCECTDRKFQRDDLEISKLKNHPGVLELYLSRARFKKNGGQYEGFCPFHNDRQTPSCKLNDKTGRWLWFCFGKCQRGGSVVDFVMEHDHLAEGEAIKTIRQELGESPAKSHNIYRSIYKSDDYEKQPALITISLTDYAVAEKMLASNQTAQEWLLNERGVSYESAKRLHVGYRQKIRAGDENLRDILDQGWIIFPCIENGIVVSLKYRSLVRKAFSRKYGMASALFNTAAIVPLGTVYVTAGEFDTLALEQAGFCSISLPSDSFTITPEMKKKLGMAGKLVLAGDSDESGVRAMDRMQEEIPEALRLRWPEGIKDANELWMQYRNDMAGFQQLIGQLTDAAVKAPVAEVIPELEEEAPESIPICPPEVLSGGYIGELTQLLTEGTTIPPEFVFQNIMMLLGAMVDGKVGFNCHQNIHTRFYSVNVSDLPRSGKGESWARTGEETTGLLAGILAEQGITVIDASLFGSGEFMVGSLSEHAKLIQKDDPAAQVNVVARCDEMAEIFEKSKALGSTLQTKLLQMFERNTVSTGSFKNKEHSVHNLHFSISGDFTFDGFQKAFAGQGAGGSGLLSRFTYAFAKRGSYKGRWPQTNNIKLVQCLAKITECLGRVDFPTEAPVGILDDLDSLFAWRPQPRYVPVETGEAAKMHEAFLEELELQEGIFTSELPSHFRRFLLLQTIFSDNPRIDEDRTRQAISWTRHQFAIRKALWPEDGGKEEEQFERKILKALVGRKLSLRRLMDWCHVDRAGSGGHETFLRALNALKNTQRILGDGQSRKGSPLYALAK